VEGKTFSTGPEFIGKITSVAGVAVWCPVLEENALLKYRDRQAIATVKGVGPEFTQVSGIDSMLIDGELRLDTTQTPMAAIGRELAGELGIGLNFINTIHLYVPKRTGRMLLNPLASINERMIFPSGVFGVQQEYDSKYLIVPVGFARELFDYKDTEVPAVEIRASGSRKVPEIIRLLQEKLGPEYQVADRLRQHDAFYRVMRSEKWAIFLILSFILIIASFNTISSLTLLMLEKKPDMQILRSLGAGQTKIRQVFLWEGILVTGVGMVLGLVLGGLVCWAQQQFGIVRFPESGSFVVNVYPVRMLVSDFLLVMGLVGVIGFMAAWVPLRVLKGLTGISRST
jgi:lipoprotein-releasing system permease protein